MDLLSYQYSKRISLRNMRVWDMEPHSGEKSRKNKTHMSTTSKSSAIDAYFTDTINVMENAPTISINDVCHVKYLKVGLWQYDDHLKQLYKLFVLFSIHTGNSVHLPSPTRDKPNSRRNTWADKILWPMARFCSMNQQTMLTFDKTRRR